MLGIQVGVVGSDQDCPDIHQPQSGIEIGHACNIHATGVKKIQIAESTESNHEDTEQKANESQFHI